MYSSSAVVTIDAGNVASSSTGSTLTLAGTLTATGINVTTVNFTSANGDTIGLPGVNDTAGALVLNPTTANVAVGTITGASKGVTLSGTPITVNGTGAAFTESAAGTIGGAGTLTVTSGTATLGGANTTTGSSGTVTLNHTGGSALTGPVAVASGATVGLGTNNQIVNPGAAPTQPSATPGVTLSGGTLAANGHNENNPTGGATTPSAALGPLALTGSNPSTLDFGDPNGTIGNVIAFADSSLTLGSSGGTNVGSLKLTNYVDGVDQLYVGSSTDLTTAQLDDITTFNGQFAQYAPSNNGLITFAPAPEPSGVATFAFVLGIPAGLIVLRRRKAQKAA